MRSYRRDMAGGGQSQGEALVRPSESATADRVRDQLVDARMVLSYLLWFLVIFLGAGFIVRARLLQPATGALRTYDGFDGYDGVRRKSAYYERNASQFDLLFVGDSRTYCGVDPYVVDPILGTRSFVLATFSHWLSTQFANDADILGKIPPNATVVWSIGHINFQHVHETEHLTYPIGLTNVPRYLKWGYDWGRIGENAVGLLPGLDIYAHRVSYRAKFDEKLDRNLMTARLAAGPQLASEPSTSVAALVEKYKDEAGAIHVDPIVRDGRPTSVAILTDRGNLRRVEIDHGFHRAKQEEAAAKLPTLGDVFEPAPELWNTFLGILDLFQSRGIRLVVSEFQEAPFNYRNAHNRTVLEAFMLKVQREVESRHFPYVKVDFSRLSDSDYFDYDHLNSAGIPKYSTMLAERLRPHLPLKAHFAVQ